MADHSIFDLTEPVLITAPKVRPLPPGAVSWDYEGEPVFISDQELLEIFPLPKKADAKE